ncbi:hypothetical protein GCM10011365_00920 [Marinicella pacifica]|uniref:DUF4124 domain-containing protein n=1 Tax=Marinicella pacifica TaxID=1171543 RepID=A0A917FHM5_9GAMM|nr:DUF4124 domain-containing protein [Marinicella pacifica]GGF83756.1 hypothetical protein GCM10011365_00920 [Marinicella pacifica]
MNTATAKQKYYKWTDENGSIHYSTEKPENNQTEELDISTKQPDVPVEPIRAHAESETSDEPEEKSYLEQRREKKQKAKKLAQENRERCLDAKHIVNRYQQQVRMSRIDRETGEKIYLDDTKRASIIKSAQQAVRKYCR